MSAAPKFGLTISFELEVLKGPHAGQRFTINKPQITIGRGSENQIVLSQDLRVSRVHAEIKNTDGQLYFTNISQKNYVLVDGVKSEFHHLKQDCTLTIGESELRFRFLENKAQPHLTPVRVKQTLPSVKSSTPTLAKTPSGNATLRPLSSAGGVFPSYGSPAAQGFQAPPFPAPKVAPESSNRFRFYLILGVVGLVLYFSFFNTESKKSRKDPIRNSEIIEREMQKSQEQIELLESKLNKKNNLSYKRAEENFIKGFRDYQKGQYLRAKEYFRIVLNLNPEHIEARKYYEQSIIRHRKLMEFNFIEGLKSKERKNYRLCKSFFSQVLILAQGDRSSYEKYDEAEKYLRECTLGLEGRF